MIGSEKGVLPPCSLLGHVTGSRRLQGLFMKRYSRMRSGHPAVKLQAITAGCPH
ncbi:unnamed protein product [Staurois parvus]|uniref:Uncharacterized protein n=1 Tax=Staurois parvus TaxID=386267 RepID=A0ABN9F586_9NEOB|nr:unnamed protein product [Staurois parvus]